MRIAIFTALKLGERLRSVFKRLRASAAGVNKV